jgi:hypothetical protein
LLYFVFIIVVCMRGCVGPEQPLIQATTLENTRTGHGNTYKQYPRHHTKNNNVQALAVGAGEHSFLRSK